MVVVGSRRLPHRRRVVLDYVKQVNGAGEFLCQCARKTERW